MVGRFNRKILPQSGTSPEPLAAYRDQVTG